MFSDNSTGDDLLKAAVRLRLRNKLALSHREINCLLQASPKEQIHLVRTDKQEPIAYMAYGKINRYSLALLANRQVDLLRDYELNDGHILYIMDLVVSPDHARYGWHLLKREIAKYRLVCGVRNGVFRLYLRRGKSFRPVTLRADFGGKGEAATARPVFSFGRRQPAHDAASACA